MADDTAKRDFSDILKNLHRKFDINEARWIDDKFFEIKFRTQVSRNNDDYNALCDEWVDLFSSVTSTIWVHTVSNTGPKVKFRKQYQCWTYQNKEVEKELLFDARRCKGTIDVKVLGENNPLSRKKSKHMKLGLNVLIKIHFYHLHPVDTTKNFSFFVHSCQPLKELPKRVVQSNDRLPQLVAKMVQKAAITSQKAAERAEEALKRQCIQPENPVITSAPSIHLLQNMQFHGMSLDNIESSSKYELKPPLTQVVVGSDGQMNETYFMCQQLMVDSSMQIIKEVIPVSGANISANIHDLQGQQYIEVQLPQEDVQGGNQQYL